MFKTKKFLKDQFINPTELLAFLHGYGVKPPQREAVVKWFQRGSVPSDWMPVLLAYLQLDRGEINLSGYMK